MLPSHETLQVHFHALAQPVRSRSGWLLACQAPSSEHQLTLLVDFAASDKRPEWDLMPGGPQRILLMLDSPRSVRLHFDLRTAAHRVLRLNGMECTITAAFAGSKTDPTAEGFHYELIIGCRQRPPINRPELTT